MKALQKPKGCCYRTFALWRVRVVEQHSVLGIFQHPEGTNFSTTERVACFHVYMIAVMACSAIFYGADGMSVCPCNRSFFQTFCL